MSATNALENNLHYPVLLKEVLSIISPQNGGTFIDCTFGQGGYSKKILQFSGTQAIKKNSAKDILILISKKNFFQAKIRNM